MTTSQTWMITGAGRGLGRALTLAALEEGHTVVATVRGEHSLPAYDRLHVHRFDVRDRSAAAAAVDAAVAAFGRLDVLVNNAGYGLIGAIEEVSEEEVRSLLDTDLLGPLWLCQAALPVMRKQGGGHIVQISTVGAVGTMPTLGLYNAAKWGLEGWTEAMAAEVAAFGVHVTIVQPGSIDTDWASSSMRFAKPMRPYDDLRTTLFGSPDVPWPVDGTAGGTAPAEIAAGILTHVADHDAGRLRLLAGDDAPGQVKAALEKRRQDYALDPRWQPFEQGN
ncbi:SDR family NAD(P)-dependent oxidoreductase [Arthrobacter zhaoguopingii]|uniref:SDR family NAD(P)-dependent oxidoreductase n=1 Tax=Arthrobacter zhaoguopingii TaxID=2681491 RepID=UPI001FEFDD2F|nr:SDR family NAD(P)-dependent oxidoreductase [Arthrobacter zhaoguopingii]